jgi:hypothetical protein
MVVRKGGHNHIQTRHKCRVGIKKQSLNEEGWQASNLNPVRFSLVGVGIGGNLYTTNDTVIHT